MINIDYQLTGTGWSECTISNGDKFVVVSASYLSDALGNLLSAALKLINGEKIVKTSFDEEPGEYRWIFEINEENLVHLTILKFEELWGNEPDSAGKNIFQINCTLEDLVSAFSKATDKVFKEYGEEGYLREWAAHKFPIEQYNDINKWLKEK